MSILKQHIRQNIRFKKDDLILYNPNEEQLIQLENVLKNNIEMDENLNAKGTLSEDVIRYIFRDLTSVGSEIDEITSDELSDILDNGDNDLVLLLREIKILINEVVSTIQFNQYEEIEFTHKLVNIMAMNSDTETIKKKFDKLMKKHKKKVTFDEFVKNGMEISKIEKEKN